MRMGSHRRGLLLANPFAVALVAVVLAAVIAPAALDLLEHAKPVLPDGQLDVLRRGHAPDGVDQQRVAARVLRNAAAPAEHGEAVSDVLGADLTDQAMHLLAPLVVT